MTQPERVCPNCKQRQWWQRDDGEWVCERCHPNPFPSVAVSLDDAQEPLGIDDDELVLEEAF